MIKGNNKKKVLLGMSGGVDSSVAAHLLLQEGYEVVGTTIQMKEDKQESCCKSSATDDAKKVADTLGIEFHVFNMKEQFQKCVIEYFISEYKSGRTPNPCVVCNRFVKFEAILQKAKELNIDYIATGHYANVEKNIDGRYLLKKAKDETKDQSYVLYNLTQEQLSRTLFPLGKFHKTEIREIAKNLGFSVATKPDSQEICFIEDNDYNKFIQENSDINTEKGEFVDIQGNVLGYHDGITKYTIGQRRGIGLSFGKPIYVVDIDIESNRVVLGTNEDIFKKESTAENLNFISTDNLSTPMKVDAKIRYKAQEAPATITPIGDKKVKVVFDTPQRAITPGQSVVFYKDDIVVGGGVIEK